MSTLKKTRVTLTHDDLIILNWALEGISFEDKENEDEFVVAHKKLIAGQKRLDDSASPNPTE